MNKLEVSYTVSEGYDSRIEGGLTGWKVMQNS